jgi:hypothetical protein
MANESQLSWCMMHRPGDYAIQVPCNLSKNTFQ